MPPTRITVVRGPRVYTDEWAPVMGEVAENGEFALSEAHAEAVAAGSGRPLCRQSIFVSCSISR